MRRQLLDPVGTESVEGVVRRLGAVPAQLDSAAELAVRTRRQRSRPGEVARALADGRIIKTFAFRGATHLMTPEDGGVYLALRAASRMWELPSWQSYYSLAPSDWPRLREVVRQALADGPLTLEGLGAAITARSQFRHLTFVFDGNPWTLLKALAWQGDLSFGPGAGRARRSSAWTTTLAGRACLSSTRLGPRAVEAYFGRTGRRRQTTCSTGSGKAWALGASGSRPGSPASAIASSRWTSTGSPRSSCASISRTWPRRHRPLRSASSPAYDQWVLGPGTADPHVVPPARRALVSRGANIVIVGGVVSGTWTLTHDQVAVDWFAEAWPPPGKRLADEVERLATILDLPLQLSVQTA